MVQNCDCAPEFVVAPLERVGDAVLGWTSRCPDTRRGPVCHRRRAGILCEGSLRRVVALQGLYQGSVTDRRHAMTVYAIALLNIADRERYGVYERGSWRSSADIAA